MATTLQHDIPIHTRAQYEPMREAGQLAARVLDMITEHVQPGVTTDHLNTLCDTFIRDHGATPAPLNYRGFPKSICTSINHVVCHGIPNDKPLAEGDIVNIDVTVVLNGWHGDSSRMYFAGIPSVKARRLTRITYEALWKGIEVVRPGATLGDIGHAIQSFVEFERCSVVRDYCGHGIGRRFHTPPSVLHYGRQGAGTRLESGMFFTIEPMVNLGTWEVKLKRDGWTVVTRDRQLSAQFEHTLAVTDTGYEAFTLSPEGKDHPDWS